MKPEEVERPLAWFGEGWGWRLDPEFIGEFDYRDVWPALAREQCRPTFVYGDGSAVLTPAGLAAQKSQGPAGMPFVRIRWPGTT